MTEQRIVWQDRFYIVDGRDGEIFVWRDKDNKRPESALSYFIPTGFVQEFERMRLVVDAARSYLRYPTPHELIDLENALEELVK